MSELAKKKCIPCQGGIPPLTGEDLDKFAEQVPHWTVVNGHHLERELTYPDFRQALDFTNKIGELAEAEGHHPDIYLSWGKLGIKIWTHKIDGLTESDFILAAKINLL
jgi:4a-hydroxytetrahydrobiopterin dehydratase